MALPVTNSTSDLWYAPAPSSTTGSNQAGAGSFRLALDSLVLPTKENVAMMADKLAGSLTNALQKAGIPAKPDFTMTVDPNTGHIAVSGNRTDTKQIEDLLNKDPKLAQQVRNTNAIAGHAEAIQRAMQAEEKNMHDNDPMSVNGNYCDLFSADAPRSYALKFNGSSVECLVDGASWFSN